MRRAQILALANPATDQNQLAGVVASCLHSFLCVASSQQHRSKLNAMDAIGLIKLCRRARQPSRIADIWPHIEQLSMLPAKDRHTSCALIGSVISCALEAKDSSTAASVWGYLRSNPSLPLQQKVATQLLSALRGEGNSVVEMIIALHNGTHSVRADAQHSAVAMQSLAHSPDAADRVFEIACQHKTVDAVALAARSRTLQQRNDFDGVLNTLAIADSLCIVPEPAHYTVLLSCAAEMKNLAATKRIHQHLSKHSGPSCNIGTIGALVHGFAKCDDYESATLVFEQAVQHKRVGAVTLIVWCRVLQERGDLPGALNTLSIADSLSIAPEPAHYTLLLSCAAKIADLASTKRIHEHLGKNLAAVHNHGTMSALIQTYGQCGDFHSAKLVFERALEFNLVDGVTLVVWCQVLQHNKNFQGALSTLSIADSLCIIPQPAHYTVLLSCAAEMKSVAATRLVHEHLNNHPTLKQNEIVVGALLQSYSRCGDFCTAAVVFEHMLKAKKVSGVVLAVWCRVLHQREDFYGALHTLSIADSLSITPEPGHYVVLLACAAELRHSAETKHIHKHLNKHPTVKGNNTVIGALLQAYSRCGNLKGAKLVFDEALKNGQVSGVTLVVWCQLLSQHQDLDGALDTISIADSLRITPEPAHYTALLLCAATRKSLTATKHIHHHLNQALGSNKNVGVIGALIQSYSQCGDFETAASVFQLAVKEKMASAITLLVWCQVLLQQRRDFARALNTLSIGDSLRIAPEPAHYKVLLSHAAEIGSLSATKKIYKHMLGHPFATRDAGAIGALVHSYVQCGDLQAAVDVFEDGLQRGLVYDVKGWTGLLNAYAGHGMAEQAQATFERMVVAGVKPDEATITCLLSGASHAGLGMGVRKLHNELQSRFSDLHFGPLHRTCVVDGLARAGLFEEAVAEAHELKYDVAWTAVLGAARSHNRLDIGELAFNKLKQLSTDNTTLAAAHVLMAHIYTANDRGEEAAQMRQHMKNDGLRKLPGESSIEVDGVMHTFRVNDTSHPEMQQIAELNDKLHEQLKADGYVPDVVWASRGAKVSTQTKEQALCEHSERFALVYGLLHSDEGQPLTIFKNLRVCGDCHNATKHASKVLNRKLTVKDMNRWHVFENGKCSCGDFW